MHLLSLSPHICNIYTPQQHNTIKQACNQLYSASGTTTRCRVDFDTSIGDETYTTLKSSTEFMQQFVR